MAQVLWNKHSAGRLKGFLIALLLLLLAVVPVALPDKIGSPLLGLEGVALVLVVAFVIARRLWTRH